MVRVMDLEELEQDALKRNIPVMAKRGNPLFDFTASRHEGNVLFRNWLSYWLFGNDDGYTC